MIEVIGPDAALAVEATELVVDAPEFAVEVLEPPEERPPPERR
jgi:hypothetical protein